MFQWNAEKVRFMEDAAAWGDFHARLAAEMAPYLPRDGHVCDAGCGTGHLALALAPYVKRVTAVDVSAQALALLTENCRKRGAANIDIRCGDIARLPPEQPYDAMVFCFFGHIEEILTISAAQCRGTVLAVMRNDGCHRFSAAQGAVRHGGYPRGAAELTARGIPFHAVERELPMGQPFRTIDDARRFFQLYRRPDDTTPVTDDFLRQRLEFINRAGLVVVETNLPEESLQWLCQHCTAPILADPVSTIKARRLEPVLGKLTALKPNRMEAELLSGVKIESAADVERAADKLLSTGLQQVYISMGGDGLFAKNAAGETARIPCPKVTVANATGGGDAMAAALAACITQGRTLEERARLAIGAGALACTSEETIHPGMSWENINYILNKEDM